MNGRHLCAKMKRARSSGSTGHVKLYRSVIVLQFVFIVVLICMYHKREYFTVLSSRPRDKDNQPVNHNAELDGHHEENDEATSELIDVYKHRLETAKRFCDVADVAVNATWLDDVPRGRVWSYSNPDTEFHYCGVPKVGTTVWKSIFRFLYKNFPNGTEPSRPSEIDRYFVHYGRSDNVDNKKFECFKSMQKYSDGKLFMFTRDPYTRLWSAYIDKFVLPDFWKTSAMKAYKTVHKLKGTVPTSKICFKNITFTEFLQFVVAEGDTPNEHWAPIHTLCSPCHAKFDFIGKQETFFQDYKYILNKYKMGHLIEEASSESRVKHETNMLIKYNFGIGKRFGNQTGCFVPHDIAQRLWKVFQYNGYIHEHIDFPAKALNADSFEADPMKELYRLVLKTIEDQKRAGLNIKGQKRALMVAAYKGVPSDVLKAVEEVYVHDFDIFGYERRPDDVFKM